MKDVRIWKQELADGVHAARLASLYCCAPEDTAPQAARYAAAHGFGWFTTTLSISPMKDPVRLNTIGCELGERYGVQYLQSEFRKKDGYKRSLVLSEQYGLYRQEYCGCAFSKAEREAQAARRAAEAKGEHHAE